MKTKTDKTRTQIRSYLARALWRNVHKWKYEKDQLEFVKGYTKGFEAALKDISRYLKISK